MESADYTPVQSSDRSASLANLTPFPKGVSGNPAGRPVGIKDRRTIARQFAEFQVTAKHVDGKELQMTAEQAAIAALYLKAHQGDVAAIKELQDTLYGKIADKQELTGAGGAPLQGIIRTVVDPKANDNPTN